MTKQSKDEWERNINRLIKSDSRTRFKNLSPPVRDAMHALDQIKAVDGKTPFETHPQLGMLAGAIISKRYGVEGKWDKKWEYKIFLKDSLLHEEATFHQDLRMSEQEWMAVETYAVEEIGIKRDIVYKGNLFRKEYVGCSISRNCIKWDKPPYSSFTIDNDCRAKCQDESAEKTGFFTKEEVKRFREINETMV